MMVSLTGLIETFLRRVDEEWTLVVYNIAEFDREGNLGNKELNV
jgi:hypothetical protein